MLRALDALTVSHGVWLSDADAATSASTAGRMMYAGMRTLQVLGDPVARLWHSATMLREHRADGYIAALVGARIGGTEAHVSGPLR